MSKPKFRPSPPEGSERGDEFREAQDLERTDDVLGSGIFDPPGASATANIDTGVFASHNSLPGYLAREIPFVVMQDVTDLTSDASNVEIPGGGLNYVESRGELLGPACMGPTTRPPPIYPATPGGQYQTYAYLSKREQPPDPAWVPREAHPDACPGQPLSLGSADPTPYHLPEEPNAEEVAMGDPARGTPGFAYHPGAKCNYRFPPAQAARVADYSIQPVITTPLEAPVPQSPAQRLVPLQMDVSPRGQRLAFGAEEPGPDWKKYALIGLGIGALAAFASDSFGPLS